MASLPEPKSPVNITKPLTEKEKIDYDRFIEEWNKIRRSQNALHTFQQKQKQKEEEEIPELCRGCETGTDNDYSHCIIDPKTGDTIYHPECYCMNKH